jgi:hypothetical protein
MLLAEMGDLWKSNGTSQWYQLFQYMCL